MGKGSSNRFKKNYKGQLKHLEKNNKELEKFRAIEGDLSDEQTERIKKLEEENHLLESNIKKIEEQHQRQEELNDISSFGSGKVIRILKPNTEAYDLSKSIQSEISDVKPDDQKVNLNGVTAVSSTMASAIPQTQNQANQQESDATLSNNMKASKESYQMYNNIGKLIGENTAKEKITVQTLRTEIKEKEKELSSTKSESDEYKEIQKSIEEKKNTISETQKSSEKERDNLKKQREEESVGYKKYKSYLANQNQTIKNGKLIIQDTEFFNSRLEDIKSMTSETSKTFQASDSYVKQLNQDFTKIGNIIDNNKNISKEDQTILYTIGELRKKETDQLTSIDQQLAEQTISESEAVAQKEKVIQQTDRQIKGLKLVSTTSDETRAFVEAQKNTHEGLTKEIQKQKIVSQIMKQIL